MYAYRTYGIEKNNVREPCMYVTNVAQSDAR